MPAIPRRPSQYAASGSSWEVFEGDIYEQELRQISQYLLAHPDDRFLWQCAMVTPPSALLALNAAAADRHDSALGLSRDHQNFSQDSQDMYFANDWPESHREPSPALHLAPMNLVPPSASLVSDPPPFVPLMPTVSVINAGVEGVPRSCWANFSPNDVLGDAPDCLEYALTLGGDSTFYNLGNECFLVTRSALTFGARESFLKRSSVLRRVHVVTQSIDGDKHVVPLLTCNCIVCGPYAAVVQSFIALSVTDGLFGSAADIHGCLRAYAVCAHVICLYQWLQPDTPAQSSFLCQCPARHPGLVHVVHDLHDMLLSQPFDPAAPPPPLTDFLFDLTEAGFLTATFVCAAASGSVSLFALSSTDQKFRCYNGNHPNPHSGQARCDHKDLFNDLLSTDDEYFIDRDAMEQSTRATAGEKELGVTSRPCLTNTPINLPLPHGAADLAAAHDFMVMRGDSDSEEVRICQLDCSICGTALTHDGQSHSRVLLVARSGAVHVELYDGFCDNCEMTVPYVGGEATGVFAVHRKLLISLALLVQWENSLVEQKTSKLSMFKAYVHTAWHLHLSAKIFSYLQMLRAIWGFQSCRVLALVKRPEGLLAPCVVPGCEYDDVIVDGIVFCPAADQFPESPVAPTGDAHPRGVTASTDPTDLESGRYFVYSVRAPIIAACKSATGKVVLVAGDVPLELLIGHSEWRSWIAAFHLPKASTMTGAALKVSLQLLWDLASDSYIDAFFQGVDLTRLLGILGSLRLLLSLPAPSSADVVSAITQLSDTVFYIGRIVRILHEATGFPNANRRTFLVSCIDITYALASRVAARPSRNTHWSNRGQCSACAPSENQRFMVSMRRIDRVNVASPIVDYTRRVLELWGTVTRETGASAPGPLQAAAQTSVDVRGSHMTLHSAAFHSAALCELFLDEVFFGELVLREEMHYAVVIDDVDGELLKKYPFAIATMPPVRPICKVFETAASSKKTDKSDNPACRKIDLTNTKGKGGYGSLIFACSHGCIVCWVALKKHESSRDVYDVLRAHWPLAPRTLVYDTACVTGTFAQIRDYHYFKDTVMSVDRLHVNYHTGCSRAYHPSSHPSLSRIVTVVCEQLNETLRPFKHSTQHATFPHFKTEICVVASRNNDRVNAATLRKLL
jgi:hypothetical protein